MPILIFLLLFGYGWASSLPNGCPADFSVHRLLPHEADCGKFYSCSNGRRVLMQCPRGTSFDVEIQVCNWSDAIQCNGTTTTPVPTTPTTTPVPTTPTTTPVPTTEPTITTTLRPTPVDCPPEWTVTLKLREDSDCEKYFHCSDHIKLLLKCPKRKSFDMLFAVNYAKVFGKSDFKEK